MTDWAPSDHGRDGRGLQRRVVRGLTWTLLDTWGSLLLGLVIFAVLTHLLQPEDFGLVALAAVFVALGQLFADQGLGDAVIQRARLTRRQLDTVFWVAMATGAVLLVAGVALAGPVARLVGEPRLEPILQVLSLVFPLVGLSSIQMALLRREMAFRSLAVRKLASVGIGGGVGIAMAFAGFGAWALVGQQLASAFLSIVLLWAVSPWRPNFAFSATDFRALSGYSVNVVAGDFLGFLSRNVDNLLIGVFLGPFQLGFYAVAYRILDTSQQILLAAARRLVFPTLARFQHDMERVRRAYLRLSQLSGAATLPSYLGLALVAPEAITVIFGQKWAPAGMTASILFLIGPVQTIQAFSGAVWNAVGQPGVTLRFRLVSTVVNVVGFLIAVIAFRDIIAVAAAYTIRGYLLLPLNLYWMRRYAGVSIREMLLQLKGPIVATVVMAVTVIGVKFAISGQVTDAVLLAVEVISGAVAFTIALFFVQRHLLLEVVGVLAQAIPGGERLASRFGLPVHGRGELQPDGDAQRVQDVQPIGPDLD